MGLDNLKEFLSSIVFTEGIPIAKINLRENWEIINNPSFTVEKDPNTPNSYYVLSNTENKSTDYLMMYIKSIIEYNIDLEKRLEWFNLKVVELKKIIKHNTSEELKKFKIIHTDLESNDKKSKFSQYFGNDETHTNEHVIEENIHPISILDSVDNFNDFEPQYPRPFVMEKEEDFNEDNLEEMQKQTFKYNPETGDIE